MTDTQSKETKKKREHFMIEIRKDKNTEFFRNRRKKVDPRHNQYTKSEEYQLHEFKAFQNNERSLRLAITSNDTEEVYNILDMIRRILTVHSDADLVPWESFLNTKIFDLITVDLRNKDFYNDIDIKKEVIWYDN